MGWDENDQCDELSLEEVNTFLVSCPDFLKKWVCHLSTFTTLIERFLHMRPLHQT